MNKANEEGWQYLHVNESGRKELFSGIFETQEKAHEWFRSWGPFWASRGVNLTKHTYKPGYSSNGYYHD